MKVNDIGSRQTAWKEYISYTGFQKYCLKSILKQLPNNFLKQNSAQLDTDWRGCNPQPRMSMDRNSPRGYDSGFVESQFSRVKGINRTSLFTRKESSETKIRNCFVVDYHPALSALYGIFRELQQIVGLSDSFLSLMPEPPMISFRIVDVGGMFKCGSRKCKACDNVLVG
jgi:hypothetical protein